MIRAILLLGLVLSIIGGVGYVVHRYNVGQAAVEQRKAMCEAFKVKPCTADAVAAHVEAQRLRLEATEKANDANVRSLGEVRQALEDQRESIAEQGKRLETSRANLALLSRKLETVRRTGSPEARAFLEQKVPDEVRALMRDEEKQR